MKTSVRLIALLIAITATLVTQPMQGGQIPSASFIENSSSSLTLIYNGMDITATAVSNTSADHWTVTLPQSLTNFGAGSWTEPENPFGSITPTGWNQINWNSSTSSSTELLVVSDTFFNGQGVPSGQPINFGNQITLQYTDVSDGAVTTPDTGSTLGLLSLALAALVGVSRLHSIRLA